MTYYLHELRNLDNVAPAIAYAGTLHGAKVTATRNQAWAGTVLKITDQHGRTISTKTPEGWADNPEA